MTSYERYQYNLKHASDSGSLYTQENKDDAWLQYRVEQLLEAADMELTDDRSLEEDFNLLLTWIRTVNQ